MLNVDNETFNAIKSLEHFFGFTECAAFALVNDYKAQNKEKDLFEFVRIKQEMNQSL